MRIARIKTALGLKYRLIKIYTNLLKYFSFDRVKQQEIIICFDGTVSHGGLVDRLKGIISFFEISKLLAYDFKILFNSPYPLTNFLVPNEYDWSVKEVKYNPFNTLLVYMMDDININTIERIKISVKKRVVVYCNVDLLGIIYSETDNKLREKIWRDDYRVLFKPSNALSTQINKFPLTNKLSFHTRFTSLMGDFKDSTSKVLIYEEQQALMKKLKTRVENIVSLNSEFEDIYILSDSITFLSFIKTESNYSVLSGSPKHMDFFKGSDAQLKTFIDFYFLIESDKVILLKLNEMYNSNFSRYAAIIGNIPFELIDN